MKKIISLLLTLVMLIGVAVSVASCGGDSGNGGENGGQTGGSGGEGDQTGGNGGVTETGVDYTVTVTDTDGNALSGISLKFTYGKNETEVKTTDANGKVTAKIDTLSDVVVEFVDLVGFDKPKKSARTFDDDVTELTVALTRLQSYTVKVVDENGAAVSGVSVQICHSVCLLPMDTDENGTVVRYFNTETKVKVSIASVPDGYAIPDSIEEFDGLPVHAYFTDGETEVTVVIPTAK